MNDSLKCEAASCSAFFDPGWAEHKGKAKGNEGKQARSLALTHSLTHFNTPSYSGTFSRSNATREQSHVTSQTKMDSSKFKKKKKTHLPSNANLMFYRSFDSKKDIEKYVKWLSVSNACLIVTGKLPFLVCPVWLESEKESLSLEKSKQASKLRKT